MSTFTTERLKQLVGYAIKGVGNNKLLELSSKIGIRVDDGELYLNTTDGEINFSVSDSCLADDMDVTVDADLFAKLISKITSETVDMYTEGNTLVIKGNGKYTLEIVPDETGNALSFPDKFPLDTTEIGRISAVDIVAINTTVGASLDDNAGSVYSNYYVGDVVASTDRIMMCVFNLPVFDEPYSIRRKFIDLMTMSGADVVISKSGDTLMAESDISEKCSIRVCTKIPDNISEFKIDGVKKYVDMEVKSFCRVRKAQLLELLDRMSLFVTKFDDGAIRLHFIQDCIEVSSLASSGIETVDIIESKDAQDMEIKINIERLRNQLKSYNSDTVDIYYGSDMCIKLVDGSITQLIALIK